MSKLIALLVMLTMVVCTMAQRTSRSNTNTQLGSAYWPLEKSQPLIDKTQTIRLAPDLSSLSAGEKKAVEKLLAVGQIFQQLYEEQRHSEALSSYRMLKELDQRGGSSKQTQNLLTLYRLFQGPIATTLDNKREPFLPVEPLVPGKNVYPLRATKEDIDSRSTVHNATSENKNDLLDLRSVVRVALPNNVAEDVRRLSKYPALQTLHPHLLERLQELETFKRGYQPRNRLPDAEHGYYAVPYAVAYADQLMKAYTLLNEAADAVAKDDDEFARYLRNPLFGNGDDSIDSSCRTTNCVTLA